MEYIIDLQGELTFELATQVLRELDEVEIYNTQQLDTFIEPQLYDVIRINLFSNGGILSGCMAIYDRLIELKEQGMKIITVAHGMIYSAAFILFLTGDIRKAGLGTSFMWHSMLLDLPQDNLSNQEDVLAHERKMQNKLDDIVVENTKITKEELDKNKKCNVWMTYEEAKDKGIIIEPKIEGVIMTEQEAIKCMEAYGYTVVSEEEFEEMNRLKIEN